METCPNCGALATFIAPDMRGLNRGHWALPKGRYHFTADCKQCGAWLWRHDANPGAKPQPWQLGSTDRLKVSMPLPCGCRVRFQPRQAQDVPEAADRFTSGRAARSLRSALGLQWVRALALIQRIELVDRRLQRPENLKAGLYALEFLNGPLQLI
jgi:hypothetical protein